jgi:diguanylate cyclase (GGDEF)-like protein/PAS domain S-box-containing protein
MHSANSLTLVAVSMLVAIFASFTALSVSGRISAAEAGARRWWILAAAMALGGGTWAMHFIGMLAMDMSASYEVDLTIVSLIVPVLVSYVGLAAVSRFGTAPLPLAGSGLLVGSGIIAMHYTGMAAMRMPGRTISYDPATVTASVVIALVAATAALWLAFRTRGTSQRIAAAVVMGVAISGMHYTGMAAVRMGAAEHGAGMAPPGIEPGLLAVAVAGAATVLLLLALITAFFDRKLATLTAREADALIRSEERYRSLIESASDVIGILDCRGTFTYESSSAWHVLGYRSEEIVGRRLTDFVPGDRVADAQRFLGTVLELPTTSATIEMSLVHRNGERREFEIVATNLLHSPTIGGIVVNLRDITERTQLVAQLETLSETDLLTEALNRRGFTRLAERMFARCRTVGDKLAVVMMDIDHFKQVNDYYGHAAGDLVLAEVAEQCRTHSRAGDLLGRIGGEEFAILLSADDPGVARGVVQRLQKAISAATVSTIRGEVSVTASFGVAYVDPASIELGNALLRADEALYEAKKAGRDCIRMRA